MPDERVPDYRRYLKLDRLLDLQGSLEGDEEHRRTDELHFIVVHQVFELWFKLIIREERLDGIDTASLDPLADAVLESHRAMARRDLASLDEHMLGLVAAGLCELIALPPD